jgi:cellulose synthase (UDP-forming)
MTQALFLLPALLSVIVRPRAPTFKVTAKSETLQRSFLSHLATPVAATFVLLLLGVAASVWRYLNFPLEHDNLIIVAGWNLLNVVFMGAALGVVYERRQRRATPRVPRAIQAELLMGGQAFPALVEDLSLRGAQIALDAGEAVHGHLASPEVRLRVALPESGTSAELRLEIRHAVVQDDSIVLGTRFAPQSQAERDRIVELCYGSSAAWAAFQRSRQGARSILGGLVFLFWLAGVRGTVAFLFMLRERATLAEGARLVGRHGRPKRIAMALGGPS